jgi:periplasmic divalent cation tolerance protein
MGPNPGGAAEELKPRGYLRPTPVDDSEGNQFYVQAQAGYNGESTEVSSVTAPVSKKMILIYITINNMEEGQQLARVLIDRKLTNCVNFIPITCTFIWEGEITTEPEVVALVKTREEYFEEVTAVVKELVSYTNFVGQIEVKKVNDEFSSWLHQVVLRSS